MRDIEHSDIADLLNDDFLGNDLDAFISELECGDEVMAPADGAPLVDGISLVPSEAAQCGATHRVSSSLPPTSIAQPPTGAASRDRRMATSSSPTSAWRGPLASPCAATRTRW